MPTELLRRVNLDLLWPSFLERLLEVLARCQERGANYYLQIGYRSAAEQAKLWTSGRTQAGPILTGAGPFESLHQFGLAVDAVRDADMAKVGLQPYWGPEGYDLLREECEKVGLQAGLIKASGKRWDEGHIQPPLSALFRQREKEVLLQFKALYTKAMTEEIGLRAVWDEMDKIPWA